MHLPILDTTRKALSWIIFWLVIYLPFHVIISVFFTYKLDISIVSFWKEVALFLVAIGWSILYIQKKKFPRLDWLDLSILGYAFVLVLISILQWWTLKSILFWARYDLEFFVMFLVIRHTLPLISLDAQKIMHTFLISWWGAILLWICVRFLFGESVLIHFGFSDAISNWNFNGAPPIYHGVAHASVERFQWIFDGPNQAAFFLLVYMWVFWTVFFHKKGYDVFCGLIMIILLSLLVLTYSRSAYIGFFVATVVWVIGMMVRIYHRFLRERGDPRRALKITYKHIRRKYLKIFLIACSVGLVFVGSFVVLNSGKLEALIARGGSTYGHIERFTIGLLRFGDKPFGSGLASAGPASRSIYEVSHEDTSFSPNSDRIQAYLDNAASRNEHHEFTSESYYIPESWYIQQLIEWGIFGFLFFAISIFLIWYHSLITHPWICAGYTWALTMNLVLHSFESMYTSLVLFLLLGSIMIPKTNPHLWPKPKKQ